METMTGLDAKFLYSETPTAHMHTVKVVVADVSALKGGFSFDALTGILADQLCRLPPFRRRVVPVPWGLGHPVWVEDPQFDLKRHISRRTLAGPAGDRELASVVAEFAGTPLARDRPLWSCWSWMASTAAASRSWRRSTMRWPTGPPWWPCCRTWCKAPASSRQGNPLWMHGVQSRSQRVANC